MQPDEFDAWHMARALELALFGAVRSSPIRWSAA